MTTSFLIQVQREPYGPWEFETYVTPRFVHGAWEVRKVSILNGDPNGYRLVLECYDAEAETLRTETVLSTLYSLRSYEGVLHDHVPDAEASSVLPAGRMRQDAAA